MVRFKHRYLVATISAESLELTEGLAAKDIFAMLKESIATNFGDMGVGITTPLLQVRSFDATSGVCIIRSGKDSYRMVHASLTLISGTKDEEKKLAVTVDGVTGCDRTLKAAAMAAYARGYHRAGLDGPTAAVLLQQKADALDVQER